MIGLFLYIHMHTHIQLFNTHIHLKWRSHSDQKTKKASREKHLKYYKKLCPRFNWTCPTVSTTCQRHEFEFATILPDSCWEGRECQQYVSQPHLSGAYYMEGTGQSMGKTGTDKTGKSFWRYTTYLLVGDTENTQNK